MMEMVKDYHMMVKGEMMVKDYHMMVKGERLRLFVYFLLER